MMATCEYDLTAIRQAIDTIDDQLLVLINERMKLVQQVGAVKHSSGGAIYRPEREKSIINRLSTANNGPLTSDGIEAIFLEIFSVARNLELPERVAFLGPLGTFTHQAAESRFGATGDFLPMNTIASVFKAVETGQAKYGVVPVENNTQGIVPETLDLLGSSPLKIVAEFSMPIHHSLASTSDSLSQITKIYSKDIAIRQCHLFLEEHGLDSVELIPTESTSKAAKLAKNEPHSAAICPHIAAKLYHVPILFDKIEDSETNTTRFLVISNFKNSISGDDKSTFLARIGDEPGALVNFLKDFQEASINLTKIESRPSKGEGFSYLFYLDCEGHIDDAPLARVFERHQADLVWLGSYPKGV